MQNYEIIFNQTSINGLADLFLVFVTKPRTKNEPTKTIKSENNANNNKQVTK